MDNYTEEEKQILANIPVEERKKLVGPLIANVLINWPKKKSAPTEVEVYQEIHDKLMSNVLNYIFDKEPKIVDEVLAVLKKT